nr:hypothetical protein [Brevibacillus laterosporus]
MINLDVDALARFLYARKMYIKVTDALLQTKLADELRVASGQKAQNNGV